MSATFAESTLRHDLAGGEHAYTNKRDKTSQTFACEHKKQLREANGRRFSGICEWVLCVVF